jgi:hypothetical protein
MHDSTRDMAALVKRLNLECPDENVIELWSCNTGNGDNSIAAALAKAIGLPVRAPDKLIWQNGGRIRSTPKDRQGNPGNWYEFGPNGGSRIIPTPNLYGGR